MKTNKTDLMSILESVRPGLASRQTHEQATHFIFTGSDIATFNDRLCITYPYESDFKCSVKAMDFYKWLSIVQGDELNLSLDKNSVVAGVGDDQAGFTCTLDDNHKVEKHIRRRNRDAGKDFKPLPKNFLEGIQLCMFSCSSDLSQSAMNCVCIEGPDLISSDGMRLSWYTVDEDMDPCLIRARDLMELVKFPVKEYKFTDTWAHFRTDDGVVFSAKRIIGSYPDKRPHFQATQELIDIAEIELPRESLQNSLSATTVMVEEEDMVDRHVVVEVEGNLLTLTSGKKKGMATGWAKSRVELEYDGVPIHFKINPSFLHQILDQVTKLAVKDEKRGLFTRENFTHIIAFTPEKDK
jgi:DNA polymerase III sliding clamp (beta) subunit (PCNA family)